MSFSFADQIDRAYSRTLASPEDHHSPCADPPCRMPVDTDKAAPCEVCKEWFCETHLYGGFCDKCMAVDEAAEELERAA